jgi:c-di-AMP phosphodiesterase-like protein
MVAEAEEADTIGLVKVAEHLTRQIEKTAIRENDSSYTYDSEDFEEDIQELVWDAVVRTADFHDVHIDSKNAQKLVEAYTQLLLTDLRKLARVPSEIGAYETSIPGEVRQTEVLAVEE